MADRKILSGEKTTRKFCFENVPQPIHFPGDLFGALPLGVQIYLGGLLSDDKNTIFQSAGYLFSLEDFFEQIISINDGNQETIIFDERDPVHITFSPQGKNCKISIKQIKRPGSNKPFKKIQFKDQVVEMTDVIFELAKFINDYLLDLDDGKYYFLLDELEESLIEVVNHPLYTSVLNRKGVKPYEFDVERSLREALIELHHKKQSYPVYEEFLSRLKSKEPLVWEQILAGSRIIFPDKTDEEIFQITNIELPNF